MIKILILASMINVGDVSHANSVANELAKKVNGLPQTITIDANKDYKEIAREYSNFLKELKGPKENYIMLVVGEKALQTFDNLSEKIDTNAYVYCGIHQYNALLSKKLSIDHVGIPETELDTASKKAIIESFAHYTLTFAVPNNNPSAETLKAAYEDWHIDNKPKIGDNIIVMLPGDAPDEHNKMKYFSKESAEKIAREVTNLWKQVGKHYKVLIENGPRTGKFDPKTGEVACSHEYKKGEDPRSAVDDVSKHFVKSLEIPENKFQFFNFAFENDAETRNKISFHEQLLYLVQASDSNYFVVPGESISTIAQITLMLKGDQVIGVRPDSMNQSHTAIFNSAINKGFISYFDDNEFLIQPSHPSMRIEDDSVIVAGQVYEGYIEKFYE
ncbi:MAG: hypothetical protein ACRYE9_05980 [Janthinobacterium lividum]